MKTHVISAIFLRNLKSYFSNPTGYVFICVFVLLCTFAAFWPHEFFNANLANFDQLNTYLPYILLVFIPAITMSVWAEERRQGTDELLLTIPASDLDVVLGKYLAAVAIYTVSLAFSLYNVIWLWIWSNGNVDLGLIAGNYFGYWLVGLAMLAAGMVASFLTSNLTVGFILGLLFNAPLVFAGAVDTVPWLPTSFTRNIKNLSIAEQFRDFGQGVVSFTNILYFILATGIMLYLCLVLIGRRHWFGGRDGHSMLLHFIVRSVALGAACVGLLVLCNAIPSVASSRLDVTAEGLSSLSTHTVKALRELPEDHPVTIDAYISPTVPEAYVPTRLNLLSILREFKALAKGKVEVRVHPTEPFTDDAQYASDQFGIKGQQVINRSRGTTKAEEIYMGVAFTSGLNKVVVPFFDKGIPAEYELLRSVVTVAQQKRKTLAVLTTDAKLFGTFDMQRFTPGQDQQLVNELKKQYDVIQVNADSPITQEFDVLLAVQPSTLSPEQMPNFINAVRSGRKTAIFEDPFSFFFQVAGTSFPKDPPGGMNPFMQQQPPQPKGNIDPLWTMLGVKFDGGNVVWQEYNPYPNIDDFTRIKEFVFIGPGSGAEVPFNEEDSITSNLQELLFPAPGSITRNEAVDLNYEVLVKTGPRIGTIPAMDLRSALTGNIRLLDRSRIIKDTPFQLAARISGKIKADPFSEESDKEGDGKEGGDKKSGGSEIDVVLVADIDLLSTQFFDLRQRGNDDDFKLRPDNVTFVLNVLDSLAGDDRFIEVRKRRREHRTLQQIEEKVSDARKSAAKERADFLEDIKVLITQIQGELDAEVAKIDDTPNLSATERAQRKAIAQQVASKRLQKETEVKDRQKDEKFNQIERELDRDIRNLQGGQRAWATALAPLLPLLLGFIMLVNVRLREKEGVPKSRRK
ncbi:MAG: Gldg family protein [Pirellulales bacterium]